MDGPHDALPAVGTRIALGTSRGTVRYVGDVPPSKGVWLGVEWDDAERGKHDGIHQGVRYFSCRVPHAGSFIRPTAKLSLGSSFLKAVRNKYVDDTIRAHVDTASYSRKNLAEIEVEAPNMDAVKRRMAQLDRLRDVGLGGWNDGESLYVARAFGADEHAGQIRATCPNIRWLDLSRSLLPSWNEVARITAELPHLHTLLLHFNRLASVDDLFTLSGFEMLVDLKLDGTLVTWTEICRLAPSFRSVEVLQVGSNRISAVSPVLKMARLKVLNLDDNEIDDWAALMEGVSGCTNLERLIVSNNRITRIPRAQHTPTLPVRHVSLAHNRLSDWDDLDNLSTWFDELKGLVVSFENRPLLIARIASLTSLNNATISDAERRDAELFYISHKERTNGTNDPLYTSLCVKHNRVPITTKDTSTMRSKLLSLCIRTSITPPTSSPPFVTPPPDDDGVSPSANVALLLSTPLRLLQSKIARALHLPKGVKSIRSLWAVLATDIDPALQTAVSIRNELRPARQADDEGERIVYQLDRLDWSLDQYNLSDGDELVVVVATSDTRA